jgi:hypothetical protein
MRGGCDDSVKPLFPFGLNDGLTNQAIIKSNNISVF